MSNACRDCKLSSDGGRTNCVRTSYDERGLDRQPLLTIVIDNPTPDDDAVNGTLSNHETGGFNSSHAVWSALQRMGIPPDDVQVVALTRCYAQKSSITDEHVRQCLPRLWEELRTRRPKAIVAMGATVAKVLTGHNKLESARKWSGGIRLAKKFGEAPEDLVSIPITATVAPGSLYAQMVFGTGVAKIHFIEDVQDAWYTAKGLGRDPRADYAYLETTESIDAYLTFVEEAFKRGEIPGCIVDVETNQHLKAHRTTSRLVAIGFSHKKWFGRAILIDHKDQQLFDMVGMREWFLKRLAKFFSIVKTGGWNYKFDLNWIREHLRVPEFQPVFFDGLLAHNAIVSELAPHDLKSVSIDFTWTAISEKAKDRAIAEVKRLFPDRPDMWHMGFIDKAILLNYLAGDVDKSYQCYEILEPLLDDDHCYKSAEYRQKYPGMSHRGAYNRLMLDAVIPFHEIERNGLKVNRPMLRWFQQQYPKRLEERRQPLVQHPWTLKTLELVNAQAERNALVIERDRVEKRNEKEREKAKTPKKNGEAYEPKFIEVRPMAELKVDYKAVDDVLSYFLHLSRLFYDVAGVSPSKLGLKAKTKKYKDGTTLTYYTTAAPVLIAIQEWAALNGRPDVLEFVKAIETTKKDEKIHNSYVKNMDENIDKDGLVRTTYNLSGARTGRCSTSDISLHGMPTRNADDPLAVIKMFESRWRADGGLILAKDYGAMELRIVASLSGEQALIDAFLRGVDPHRVTAARIYGKPENEITTEERKAGKTINFGILYGMSEMGLAARLGCTVDEAKAMIRAFFAGYPDLGKWIAKQQDDVNSRVAIREGSGMMVPNPRFRNRKPESRNNRKMILGNYIWDMHGYITTPIGRKRILKNAGHWDVSFASKAERQAVNTPVQSVASDIALEATIRIHNRFKREGLRSLVFGFIHDSIKSDVYPGEIEAVDFIMDEEMVKRPRELYPWLLLPVETDTEVGPSWGYHAKMKAISYEHSQYLLEGDHSNLALVERAIAQNFNISLLKSEEIIDKNIVTGFKKHIQLEVKTRSRAA